MIIAVSTTGTAPDAALEPRFGRAEYFVLYNSGTGEYSSLENTAVREIAHGAGPLTAQKVADAGVRVVITGNGPGGNAARVLQTAGIAVLLYKEGVNATQAIELYNGGELTEG